MIRWYVSDGEKVLNMSRNSALGHSWDEVRGEIYTPEEIAKNNLRAALIGEFIKAREDKGIS